MLMHDINGIGEGAWGQKPEHKGGNCKSFDTFTVGKLQSFELKLSNYCWLMNTLKPSQEASVRCSSVHIDARVNT